MESRDEQYVLELSLKDDFDMLLFVFLLFVDGGLEFRLFYLSLENTNVMKGRYARYNEQKNCIDVMVYEVVIYYGWIVGNGKMVYSRASWMLLMIHWNM